MFIAPHRADAKAWAHVKDTPVVKAQERLAKLGNRDNKATEKELAAKGY